ncbi:MAG TPA: hemerythrin family protein [Accumulibacter sp.]|nr:hemerythrin family protein [Accumulibacter sp.]
MSPINQVEWKMIEYPCVEWSEKILTGLPEIDDQHRQLFELAATFCGDGDHIRILKSLAMLTEYVRVHFREEEALMAACDYPLLHEHRKLHGQFRHMLFALLENARQMSFDEIAEQVKYLINGWFYNHILIADFAYVPVVKQLGLATSNEEPTT